MTDRRRTPRYVLDAPLRGEAMPMEDVTVENYSRVRMVVVAPSAHAPDEELVVHLTTSRGVESRRATVVSSTPISVASALGYRVELRVNDDVVVRHAGGVVGRERDIAGPG